MMYLTVTDPWVLQPVNVRNATLASELCSIFVLWHLTALVKGRIVPFQDHYSTKKSTLKPWTNGTQVDASPCKFDLRRLASTCKRVVKRDMQVNASSCKFHGTILKPINRTVFSFWHGDLIFEHKYTSGPVVQRTETLRIRTYIRWIIIHSR